MAAVVVVLVVVVVIVVGVLSETVTMVGMAFVVVLVGLVVVVAVDTVVVGEPDVTEGADGPRISPSSSSVRVKSMGSSSPTVSSRGGLVEQSRYEPANRCNHRGRHAGIMSGCDAAMVAMWGAMWPRRSPLLWKDRRGRCGPSPSKCRLHKYNAAHST